MIEYNQQDSTRIPRLIIIDAKEVRTPVCNRGYTLQADVGQLTKLHDLLQRPGRLNSRISNVDVVNNLPGIITLNALPQKANIINGWDTKRARFLMETVNQIGNVTTKTYFQGYTDYIESISGMMDPNIQLLINSMVTVSITIDPVHNVPRINKITTCNIVPDMTSNRATYHVSDMHGNTIKLIRPEDVMNSLLLVDTYGQAGIEVVNGADDPNKPMVSKKTNLDPIKYFTSITNSFVDAKNTADIGHDDRGHLYNESMKVVAEDNVSYNPFLRALYNITGDVLPYSIALGTLKSIDPSMVPTYIPKQETGFIESAPFMNTEYSESTVQATAEAMKATLIANTLSAYLCELMLTAVSLSMTNFGGNDTVIITYGNSFIDGIDITAMLNKLESNVRLLLMPMLGDNGLTMFEIYVTCDITNETVVGVSLYGQPPIVFRFPSYADGLYAPVLTTSTGKDLLINDFQNVLEQTYI